MIALSRHELFDYVLEEDRGNPPEEQTVFKLRPLTIKEMLPIEDQLGQAAHAGAMPLGTFNYKVLKPGLVGWEKLVDQDGRAIPFETDVSGVKDELLQRFTTAQRTELANAVWTHAKVSDEDAKN